MVKDRILRVAEEVFADKGMAGARINEIAEKAKINKRMLYHYFGNKEELYQAVLKSNIDKIIPIHNNLTPPGDIVKQIKNAIRNYFYFLAANPNFVRLMEWEALHGSKYMGKFIPFYNIYDLPGVRGFLEAGVQEGIIRPDIDSRQIILSINAMCFFYFTRVNALNPIWDGDMLAPEMLEKRLRHIQQVALRTLLIDPENHAL